jgi:hypothetical protein
MGLLFVIGAACFVVGPVPAFANAVGGGADADTFFVGAIFFTAGGAMQTLVVYPQRSSPHDGRSLWWSATVQSAGTVLFNLTTLAGLSTGVTDSAYDRLVWVPDALGSVCFLVSGWFLYRTVPRRGGWWPVRAGRAWWEPATNMVGCVLFGISAVASYGASGELASSGLTNWGTSLGAVCFLTIAGVTLVTGWTLKSPRLRGLLDWCRRAERLVVEEVRLVEQRIEVVVDEVGDAVVTEIDRIQTEVTRIIPDL